MNPNESCQIFPYSIENEITVNTYELANLVEFGDFFWNVRKT